jgi:hypothetical protein
VTFDVRTVMQARHTDVIRHQRTRHVFAGIEPAIVERNELKHGALPFGCTTIPAFVCADAVTRMWRAGDE